VGVVFPDDGKSGLLKLRIEEILGAHLASDRATQTI
jgi:type IV pilus assembly protein PilZ